MLNIGSAWFYENIEQLRREWPRIHAIDQQFNDVGHLAANRLAREHLDLTLVAYSALAEVVLSDDRPHDEVRVVYVGIEAIENERRPTSQLRNGVGIENSSRIITFVGRLSEEKRPEWVLAAATLLAREKDLRFILVGDGPDRNRIQGGVDGLPNLLWIPHLESIVDLLDLTDILIVPSRVEGIPRVVMEALSAGVRVIATRVGGMPELEDTPGVSLVDPADFPGFVEAIRNTFREPNIEVTRLPEKFQLLRMLEAYDAAFHAVIDPSPGPQTGPRPLA